MFKLLCLKSFFPLHASLLRPMYSVVVRPDPSASIPVLRAPSDPNRFNSVRGQLHLLRRQLDNDATSNRSNLMFSRSTPRVCLVALPPNFEPSTLCRLASIEAADMVSSCKVLDCLPILCFSRSVVTDSYVCTFHRTVPSQIIDRSRAINKIRFSLNSCT